MFKKVITTMVLTCSTIVFGADNTSSQNVSSNTNSASQASSAIGANSNIGTNIFNTEAPRIPTATAFAPPISSSNDTCMGSSSAGVSTVSIGVSMGTTWRDENCVMLKNSRELWNMGFKNAAIARMCMDPNNAMALEVAGITCPDFGPLRAKYEANKSKSSFITNQNSDAR